VALVRTYVSKESIAFITRVERLVEIGRMFPVSFHLDDGGDTSL
jgi:hypothetical protein